MNYLSKYKTQPSQNTQIDRENYDNETQIESIETKIIARVLKDEAFKQELINNSAFAKAEIQIPG
ncbi:hypothetical protein [Scytonema sp. NUACC26]|uniref:hypothetical protein n=1 Tax=Scytonema sp. NUACC26 TaxID=3140176 RepID=UPI0038B238B4